MILDQAMLLLLTGKFVCVIMIVDDNDQTKKNVVMFLFFSADFL